MQILQTKDLTAYYGNHVAIKKINITINEGEYVFLIGENGSGKSTLLKTIMGLHPISSGQIKTNVEKKSISYLSQQNNIDTKFPATCREIIMTGLQEHKKLPFYTKIDVQKYKEICKMLKIENIVNKRIGDLSGGQRQRVLLARALIRKPKLIILDEPFSGLDPNITQELYSILEKLNKEDKLTIIMATHDIEEIKHTNARVISLAQTVKYDGTIKEWSKG